MHLYEVLRRPLITEKLTGLGALNKYAFEVASGANKPQIKQAVEKAFGVKVAAVNVMTVPGKMRRAGRRHRSCGIPFTSTAPTTHICSRITSQQKI